MTKQAYRVEGDFQMGRQRQHFRMDVIGENEEDARNAAFADLGSRHGVARRLISIGSVKQIPTEEANALTQKRLR